MATNNLMQKLVLFLLLLTLAPTKLFADEIKGTEITKDNATKLGAIVRAYSHKWTCDSENYFVEVFYPETYRGYSLRNAFLELVDGQVKLGELSLNLKFPIQFCLAKELLHSAKLTLMYTGVGFEDNLIINDFSAFIE